MDLLPEELLADILQRLPPRPLAVCRSVSKDLRAVIDGRGLLLPLAHRVPRGLRGMFINYVGQDRPYFFSRPADSAIDAELSFLPRIRWGEVVHHCNGLLLVEDWNGLYVCNPATRRWEQLPAPPCGSGHKAHLAFDPTVSLHYEVFFFAKQAPDEPKIPIQPDIKRKPEFRSYSEYTRQEIKDLPSFVKDKYDYDRELQMKGSIEWPPSSYVAQVFSSRTGQWGERAYVREDDVAVTVSDVWSDPWAPYSVGNETMTYHVPRCNAMYWRGSFYLHCRGGFIMRLSLLEQKYQVIKTPKLDNVFMPPRLDIDDFLRQESTYKSKKACLSEFQSQQQYSDNLQPSMHLGKSEHGIYYTALRWHQLQVWVLREASESRLMPEWELKYMADIKPSFLQHYTRVGRKEIKVCWMLDRGQIGEHSREDCGWDSSDDSGINVEEEDSVYSDDLYYDVWSSMDFLGFHPSKEIAFLGNHFDGFAYYLGTSKLQYLGTFTPVGCCHMQVAATHESFIYTPCMDDLLPANNTNSKDGGVEKEDISEDEDLEVEDEDFEWWEEEEDNVGEYKDFEWSEEEEDNVDEYVDSKF